MREDQASARENQSGRKAKLSLSPPQSTGLWHPESKAWHGEYEQGNEINVMLDGWRITQAVDAGDAT